MRIAVTIALLLGIMTNGMGQAPGPYSPPAGQTGSLAIHKDSSLIDYWATSVTIARGFMDYANPNLGFVSFGDSSSAIGKADGDVVSLGDSGYAEFVFNPPIVDRAGPELAIFENSLSDDFLELAFVEVSSDGNNFVRFSSVSLTQDTMQVGGFGSLDATNLYNLAGKYRADYGTPFDLFELKDSSGLNINAITHVRVVDVIGAIGQSFTSVDAQGNPINDPYPTAFASGGFDLDALAVLKPSTIGLSEQVASEPLFYPNPCHGIIRLSQEVESVKLYNCNGSLLIQKQTKELDISAYKNGIYIMVLSIYNGTKQVQRLIKI